MAHAKLHRQQMLDWLTRAIEADQPVPTDAEVCGFFGFASAEQARGLLAELADAGSITIRRWDEPRIVLLGRQRPGAMPGPAPRPAPSVVRADPEVDRVVARIAEIRRRGRRDVALPPAPAPARSAPKPALVSTLDQQESAVPNPPPSDDFRNINIMARGGLLNAITERAEARGLSLGKAAATLIGDAVSATPAPVAPTLTDASEEELIEALREKVKNRPSVEALRIEAEKLERAQARLATIKERLNGVIVEL